MEWADIDRASGLLATGATEPKDLVRLAFKPGTLPKAPSTPEALQQVQEAKAKLLVQGPEVRSWGLPASAEPEAPPSPEGLLQGVPGGR